MKRIKKLSSIARIAEVDTVSDKIVRLCESAAAPKDDGYFTDLAAELKDYSARITTANRRDKAVSKLEDADAVRDEAFKAFDKLVQGYEHFPEDEQKAAALRLRDVLKKYDKITSESYARESALLKSLLGDLGTDEPKAALALLPGTGELVQRIADAQKAFDEADDKYNAATVAESAAESATSLKKPILAIINDEFLPYLDTMRKVKPELFEQFAALVENEILRMNEAISKRGNPPSTK